MRRKKLNRVIYRFWHNQSDAGRVGYIGKDSYHPERYRFSSRAREKNCRKLHRAFKKYPIKFWRREILASNFKSDSALNKAEIFYINKFDSKRKGYNCTDGGEGVRGIVVSLKTRRKMSRAHKGRKQSSEWVEKRTKPRYKFKNPQNLIKLYLAGQTPRQLSIKYKVSTTAIRGFLRRNNVVLRNRSLARQGMRLSKAHRLAISRGGKGRKFSKIHRLRMSKSRKRQIPTMLGKRQSKATRLKIGRANKISAHNRWHVERGVVSPFCNLC